MRRNFRLLCKWFLLTGTVALLFKLSCDSLVDLFLSSSSSSIINIKDTDSDANYEDSLIAWASTGQRLKNERFSPGNIPDRNDLQLIGAQICFRHGARTPINLLPSLEEVYSRNLFFLLFHLFFYVGSL